MQFADSAYRLRSYCAILRHFHLDTGFYTNIKLRFTFLGMPDPSRPPLLWGIFRGSADRVVGYHQLEEWLSSSRSTDGSHQVAPNIESLQDELFPDIPKRSSKMRAHARRARKRSSCCQREDSQAARPQATVGIHSRRCEDRRTLAPERDAAGPSRATGQHRELGTGCRGPRRCIGPRTSTDCSASNRGKAAMTRDWGLQSIHPDDRDRGGPRSRSDPDHGRSSR